MPKGAIKDTTTKPKPVARKVVGLYATQDAARKKMPKQRIIQMAKFGPKSIA